MNEEIDIVTKAREFARERHSGHFRRDGVTPYFTHLQAVHDNLVELGFTNEYTLAASWLHDSVEDGKATEAEIYEIFGRKVGCLVSGLTHCISLTYEDYIQKIKHDEHGFCIDIKIADILANLADSPTEKQIKKYVGALKILLTS